MWILDDDYHHKAIIFINNVSSNVSSNEDTDDSDFTIKTVILQAVITHGQVKWRLMSCVFSKFLKVNLETLMRN
jgi:hypothetical protein